MPERSFALEAGGPERLQISWEGAFKSLSLVLDGRPAGSVEEAKELMAGRSFPLDDGTVLKVQLVQRFLVPELELTRDGEPLPGSPSGPATRVQAAANVIFAAAVANMAQFAEYDARYG